MTTDAPSPGAPAPTPVQLQVVRSAPEGAQSGLDYILVIGALILVGGGLYGLFTVKNVPSDVLPIISSLLSFVTGTILGGYAGYRWGASATQRKLATAAAP